MRRSFLFFIFTLLGSTGCAIGLGKSLHQYSFTDNPIHRFQKSVKIREITAITTQKVVIGTMDTSFSDQAYRQLLDKCPNGQIVNILASHSTSLGFFAYDNTMNIKATCLE